MKCSVLLKENKSLVMHTFYVLCQGEVGGPGQKGGKGEKGEHVSVFVLPFICFTYQDPDNMQCS